ncbi:MAG: SHOCT domain-containing protein, partial [Candidatus Methylarchaceae archaeon HK02M2]|nr:SHOCT domain-containing protein [Candidatus Methylarchaceae archaeon HK02M2]
GLMSCTLVIRCPGLSELTRLGRSTGLLAWGRGEEGSIDAIPKSKGELLIAIIREGMKKAKTPQAPVQAVSIADEIKKLAELRDAGIITDVEFEEKKKILLAKI